MAKTLVFVIIFVVFCCVLFGSDGTATTCFNNTYIKDIPLSHVYNKIKRPAIIGYRGNILKHQENSLEGMKDVVDSNYGGIYMQVQLTKDERFILFGDDSLKRMTGVDALVTHATYKHIEKMNLQTSISYGNSTLKYKKTAKIPLLEDVLNYFKDKEKLIYVELRPSNAPPKDPAGRYRGLRTGILAGKLLRRLGMENNVFILSADPFKLLALNHENSAAVSGWLWKESFFETKTAERIRKEFVDLNGLRTCYIKTAPKGVDFVKFLLENGIVTKSVNGSTFDAEFNLINNRKYVLGQNADTPAFVKKNYNQHATIGVLISDYESTPVATGEERRKKIREFVLQTGVDRIITDDLKGIDEILRSISNAKNLIMNLWLLFVSIVVCIHVTF